MTGTYEEIEQLKKIIGQIEDGDTTLEQSMQLYEQGAVLVKECEKLLAEAETKITTIGRDA
jgi:exodeoxyribonuclease VII small subunit